jgi:hypothetical protein
MTQSSRRRKCETAKQNPPIFCRIVHFSLSLCKLHDDQAPRYGRACPALPWHSGTTRIMIHWLIFDHGPRALESHIHLFFLQERKSTMHDQITSRLFTTLTNLSPTAYRKRTKQKKKRHLSYHHYSSPAPSGGIRAIDGGTLDDRDSEAQRD